VSEAEKKSDPPSSNYIFGRDIGGCHLNRFLRACVGLCGQPLVSHRYRIAGRLHRA
jgi:hypothetical protein